MGNVVPRSAGPDRIFESFDTALQQGAARPEVKSIVEARLLPLAPTVAQAQADVVKATRTVDEREVLLMARDGSSDREIGAVLDEAWNALGRPASSLEYAMVAGSGKSQWTDGDPAKQHILMAILAGRLRQNTTPALQANKEAWAQRIEAKAVLQEQAAGAFQHAEVQLQVVEGLERAVADLVQVSLVRLKRDLKNAGLTEAQIHEIIPDYVAKPRGAKVEPPVNVAPPAAPTTPGTDEAAAAGPATPDDPAAATKKP